jgi:hypothetical protein
MLQLRAIMSGVEAKTTMNFLLSHTALVSAKMHCKSYRYCSQENLLHQHTV